MLYMNARYNTVRIAGQTPDLHFKINNIMFSQFRCFIGRIRQSGASISVYLEARWLHTHGEFYLKF